MSAHPLVYEINTRCWLRELAGEHSAATLRLDQVPDGELEFWQRSGFTHVWLMGVWTTGPRTRRFSAANAAVRRRRREELPDGSDAEIVGSPYAIAEYAVAAELGGPDALRALRRRMRARGLKLILDFVPNHVGLDHPWLHQHPEFLVHAMAPRLGTFPVATAAGTRWIAHGRDPYFPPWEDTAQVDVRSAGARSALIESLLTVAGQCDGVRCDMAMLLLPDVFRQTWRDFPADADAGEAAGSFWAEAIAAVRRGASGCLLLAEVYWDREPELQELGFDFTYDKRWYDHVMAHEAGRATEHLQRAPREFLARSAHFLENHDEPRVAALLPAEEHRAAAALLLVLPGLRLVHEGQLSGFRRRASVHLNRRAPEIPDAGWVSYYGRLLAWVRESAIGRGEWRWLTSSGAVAALRWERADQTVDLALINLGSRAEAFRLRLEQLGIAGGNWREVAEWDGPERAMDAAVAPAGWLEWGLDAWAVRLLRFRPGER